VTRHMASQHEAHTAQMVALALDEGGTFPGGRRERVDNDDPSLRVTYDETVAWQDEWSQTESDLAGWLAANGYNTGREDRNPPRFYPPAPLPEKRVPPPPAKAQPETEQRGLHSLVPPPGFGLDDDAHPLAAWLPILGWLGFAGFVCLFVWAWAS
jgi:hypothetical protein